MSRAIQEQIDVECFCPEYGQENISERFCEGCFHMDGPGLCDYSLEEKIEMYNVVQRLKIGL